MQPLYDEFRVMGAKIVLFCSQQNSLTVTSALTIVVYDNDDAGTALTGLNQALDYRVKTTFASVWDNDRRPSLTATSYNIADPGTGTPWFTTNTPNQYPKSFKFYGNGLAASTQYFDYYVELVVQFRGQT
jgi:hypothetical protein